jgi:hypothetical protein
VQLTGVTTTESVQGYAGIGAASVFGGKFLRNTTGCPDPLAATTLALTGLPPHASVDLNFLLAIIDTWDGLAPTSGPDYLDVTVDGSLVFSASFKNAFGGGHPYVAPPGVLLVEKTQLGFRATDVNDQDSGFDMGKEPALHGIPHVASTLTVTWTASGSGWHHTCSGGDQDESWAIDNLSVVLWPCTASGAALETVRLGSPVNPDALKPGVTSGPVLGHVWDPRIDHTSFLPAAVFDVLGITVNPLNVVAPPFGTLLCDPTHVLATLTVGAGGAFAVPVPGDCALIGVAVCSQGASIDALGTIKLTNALDVALGTF